METLDAANDLLNNGILIQTAKGLITVSLDDLHDSDLNICVDELQKVATQLLHDETQSDSIKAKPLISVQSVAAINQNFALSDGFCDSDGFTSESSTYLHPNEVDLEKVVVKKKRGGWPKGRKRKPELLHLPPKAPYTGYNLYLNEQRKLFKDSRLPFHEITKTIGNKWSSLSLEEKKPYLEKAEEEKKRYKEELRQYRQSSSYKLYLANKRRQRAKEFNLTASESDMMTDTDDLEDEDNEELYCRTCDVYFHNLHNKREHLQGRQHMQSVAGAIQNELESDYDTDLGNKSTVSFSTSIDESSLDATESSQQQVNVNEQITQLFTAVNKREMEIKTLTKSVKEKVIMHTSLNQQLRQLKEREATLKRDLNSLKEHEQILEQQSFNLWQVPSWFVMNNSNAGN